MRKLTSYGGTPYVDKPIVWTSCEVSNDQRWQSDLQPSSIALLCCIGHWLPNRTHQNGSRAIRVHQVIMDIDAHVGSATCAIKTWHPFPSCLLATNKNVSTPNTAAQTWTLEHASPSKEKHVTQSNTQRSGYSSAQVVEWPSKSDWVAWS